MATENNLNNFTNNIKDVMAMLLSLNSKDGFGTVTQIDDSKVEIVYTGGYNNVYDHKCIVTILDFKANKNQEGVDAWFWWKFKVESDILNTDIDSDVFDNEPLSFVDFFVDGHIRDVGNMFSEEYYEFE